MCSDYKYIFGDEAMPWWDRLREKFFRVLLLPLKIAIFDPSNRKFGL